MFKLEKIECDLRVNGSTIDNPAATAVIQPMNEGDLIIGVRPAGAHPDSEYAIVGIAVEEDGTLIVTVMDRNGVFVTPAVRVSR